MRRSSSPYLVTAPTPEQRCYELIVPLVLVAHRPYRVTPWLRITCDRETQEITCAAGMRVERPYWDGHD